MVWIDRLKEREYYLRYIVRVGDGELEHGFVSPESSHTGILLLKTNTEMEKKVISKQKHHGLPITPNVWHCCVLYVGMCYWLSYSSLNTDLQIIVVALSILFSWSLQVEDCWYGADTHRYCTTVAFHINEQHSTCTTIWVKVCRPWFTVHAHSPTDIWTSFYSITSVMVGSTWYSYSDSISLSLYL